MCIRDRLRPSAEYSSVVYDSLIPEYVSDKLESVQRQAMKIIYGWDINYQKLVEDGVIEHLKDRRREAVLRFALKAVQSERFGPSWFKLNPETDINLRPGTRNRYLERRCRTERGRNNPINVMTRLLNEHENT